MTAVSKRPFGTILVPVDFSETSLAALQQARNLAGNNDLIVVCHVVDDVPLTWGYVGLAVPASEIRTKASAEAKKSLDELLHTAELEMAEVTLNHGAPHEEIVKLAKDRNAGLIVMGTHGRTGLDHALMGSVTEKVLRTAPCPVLVVKKEK